ncbi:energy transducer TonB [Tenacibaculum sp. M341]|uniref:energy transducer TonB n=1 Tax=Tenacibaculum sp. M341 TaxID=2530339 RepID=UPI00105332B0|nr:energy transducer TonB [Tenacibaculum sp. M341]TCI91099.1 energy transducer TonB [Tenacibaculum sp. M341]
MCRLLLIVCALSLYTHVSAQTKTCSKDKIEPILDLNTITKCSVEKSDNTEEEKVSVKVVSRKRILRKRDKATGIVTNSYSHKLVNLKDKISKMNELEFDKTGGHKIIPFNFVEEIPLFKECQIVSLDDQDKCFREQLTAHIRKNFKYPEKAYEEAIQGRVYVYFLIDKEGNISQIKSKSPFKGEILGEEAERIVKELPKFIPGKHNGAPITVKYGLPITFKIPGVKPSNIEEDKIKETKKVEVKEVEVIDENKYAFYELESIPQFKTCGNDLSIQCFNRQLIQHIQEYFDYPESALDDDIQGIVNIKFVVNRKGDIVNIETDGPENGEVLEEAAVNLVKKLSRFQPAVKNGKKVNAKYGFPISFSLK